VPCPSAPAGDGFHRYQLAPQSDQATESYTVDCVHCGEPKWVYPPQEPNLWANTHHRRGTAAMLAAKRQKREAP
jgi:hypothetical protein